MAFRRRQGGKGACRLHCGHNDDLGPVRGNGTPQALTRRAAQHEAGRCVCALKAEAIERVHGIERHEGRARKRGPKEGHKEGNAAVRADGDGLLGATPKPTNEKAQGVRSSGEIPVAEGLVGLEIRDGHGVLVRAGGGQEPLGKGQKRHIGGWAPEQPGCFLGAIRRGHRGIA